MDACPDACRSGASGRRMAYLAFLTSAVRVAAADPSPASMPGVRTSEACPDRGGWTIRPPTRRHPPAAAVAATGRGVRGGGGERQPCVSATWRRSGAS